MFEQSVRTEQRRPWTLAVSVTLQSAFVATAVVLSMLSIERLPELVLPTPLPPLPAAPHVVEIVATEICHRTTAAMTTLRKFTEPSGIPKAVAMIADPPADVGAAVDPNAIPGTGLPVGMYNSASTLIPRNVLPAAPPEQPVAKDKPAAPEAKRITIGGVVLEGKLVNRVMPEYPPLAVRARIQGTVRLMGVVGRDGHVRELKTIDGHPLLIPAALAAVRQWIYSPTLLNGEAVEVMAPIQVHFTLAR